MYTGLSLVICIVWCHSLLGTISCCPAAYFKILSCIELIVQMSGSAVYEAFYSAYKNDVMLAYHWLIKLYTGLPLVI